MRPAGLVLYELAGADPALRFSPHCWKARMALAHKGVQAERVPWRFTEKDTIAFSGQGLVPVLVSNGETVCDSWRIALHLEGRFADAPALFGDASAVALARFVNNWADSALLPALARIILLDVYGCLDEADRGYFRASRESRLGRTLEQVVADRPSHVETFRQCLSPLRQTLKHQDFICGAAPAYADYCVFGMFMWARCVSPVALLESGDAVFAWRERLLDAFDGLARSAQVVSAEGIKE